MIKEKISLNVFNLKEPKTEAINSFCARKKNIQNKMVGMRNETIISMRFVRSKLRKREESSHVVNSTEATQPTHVVSTVEPVGFRQSPSSVWHFPPLPPQPNLYIYNASSQVSRNRYFLSSQLQLKFCCKKKLYKNSLETIKYCIKWTWTHYFSYQLHGGKNLNT